MILVVGAGTMGHGIAQAAAAAGGRVLLHDVSAERIEAGLAQIGGALARLVEKGKLTEAARGEILGRIGAAPDLAAAARSAEFIIEAVPERIELKQETFRALDAAAPAGAVLASNTSSLSIADIASATRRPASVIGMHFFNPVPLMPLVELVRTGDTSDGVIASARSLAETMGKTTILVRDVPGFATSRLGVAIGLEAMRMLEEGVASAEDIDRAMELGYRHPMGPLRLTDLVGLDVRLAIALHLSRTLDPVRFAPPAILRRMVSEGRLGRKTGEGFYRWEK